MSTVTEEVLYSPSKWNKRYPPDTIVTEHINLTLKESQRILSSVAYTTEPYDEGNKTKLDIFGTDLPDESAVFIYIHGGYWQEKDISRETSRFVAKSLYINKIKTVIVGYDLCPDVTLTQITKQIQKAFKYCLDYCEQHNSKGLLLAGHSAGAHLVVSLFQGYFHTLKQSQQELVKAVFLLGGVYNLVPLVEIPSINDSLKLTKSEAESLSPLLQVLTANPSVTFYVIVAENESPAFVKQSKELYDRLIDCKYKARFISIANTDHFDMIEKLIEEDYEITKLIIENA